MTSALLLGLGMFAACWLLHVVIWRIHRPEAYPVWLPIIFVVMPVSVFLGFRVITGSFPFASTTPAVVAAFLLHVWLSGCYMGGYAGIIEYSPSAEILRVVRANMPQGTPLDTLHVSSLSEDALTGMRIRHLLDSRMITIEDGKLRVTPRGQVVVNVCIVYRAVFGLSEEAKG